MSLLPSKNLGSTQTHLATSDPSLTLDACVVASQRKAHLNSNDMIKKFQSGFCPQHSTETVLLKVTNDLILTSAFDASNHSILLSRLETSFSIMDTTLIWFKSSLSDRLQYICINSCKSSTDPSKKAPFQGSFLGPLLFIFYLLPLRNLIQRHGLSFCFYDDDIQLYIATNSMTPATHIILIDYCSSILIGTSQ